MKTIITEQDIINTYNQRQQGQCKLFYKYKQTKQENPTYGYKRIAKMLGHAYGKTRWWHCGKHTPTPIQTVNWLKNKNIFPLNDDNLNIFLITKVLGATFADGGIFGNLNGIFLSSSELEAVKEFGEDLKKLFGNEIEENSRIIEGGEYGHSWCYQNTNRKVIRFFQALGAPIGKKSKIQLKVPHWIYFNETIADNFVGSIFGGDGSVPKYINGNPGFLNIGITGKEGFKENRIEFLESLRKYFTMKGIKTNKIYITKFEEDSDIFRLPLVSTLDNFTNFSKNVPVHYCRYKKEKILKVINQWQDYKYFHKVSKKGLYGNYS